jgi:hypothetical protein
MSTTIWSDDLGKLDKILKTINERMEISSTSDWYNADTAKIYISDDWEHGITIQAGSINEEANSLNEGGLIEVTIKFNGFVLSTDNIVEELGRVLNI